jgi:DNA polymerase-3 subunit chi
MDSSPLKQIEVAFYQLTTTSLDKTLAKLLEKIYGSTQKAVILLDSQERVAQISSYLWTYSTLTFLPHGSAQDFGNDSARQPIWLTTEFENPNQAQVIVVTTGMVFQFEDTGFQRCLDIFDGNNESELEQAYKRFAYYKQNTGYNCVFWRQSLQGQWEQVTDVSF